MLLNFQDTSPYVTGGSTLSTKYEFPLEEFVPIILPLDSLYSHIVYCLHELSQVIIAHPSLEVALQTNCVKCPVSLSYPGLSKS